MLRARPIPWTIRSSGALGRRYGAAQPTQPTPRPRPGRLRIPGGRRPDPTMPAPRPRRGAETVPDLLAPLRPVPAPSVRPWAGYPTRRPGDGVGELWLAGAGPAGRHGRGRAGRWTSWPPSVRRGAGRAARHGAAGARFPLIVKLIDAADWLSLQVHPDDALARELYGPRTPSARPRRGSCSTADEGAELVTGPADGLAPGGLAAAIAAGEAGHGALPARRGGRGRHAADPDAGPSTRSGPGRSCTRSSSRPT